MLEVNSNFFIPLEELHFSVTRSSGPGGQHVNKVNTCVRLSFDIPNSPSLSPEQKERLLHKLASRLTKEGVLQMLAQDFRSQLANKREVIERFQSLITENLKQPRPRKKVKKPKALNEKRLQAKKERGQKKQSRGNVQI